MNTGNSPQIKSPDTISNGHGIRANLSPCIYDGNSCYKTSPSLLTVSLVGYILVCLRASGFPFSEYLDFMQYGAVRIWLEHVLDTPWLAVERDLMCLELICC